MHLADFISASLSMRGILAEQHPRTTSRVSPQAESRTHRNPPPCRMVRDRLYQSSHSTAEGSIASAVVQSANRRSTGHQIRLRGIIVKMKKTATTAACALAATATPAGGFSFVQSSATCRVIGQPSTHGTRPTTSLEMGLFDGVKEAFSAPALEKSQIDAERETPIDRWMGWSVKTEDEQQAAAAGKFHYKCLDDEHMPSMLVWAGTARRIMLCYVVLYWSLVLIGGLQYSMRRRKLVNSRTEGSSPDCLIEIQMYICQKWCMYQ